jgi:DNA-binding NtrC family response regulator
MVHHAAVQGNTPGSRFCHKTMNSNTYGGLARFKVLPDFEPCQKGRLFFLYFIVVAAYPSLAGVVAAIRAGAGDYLPTTITPPELLAVLEDAAHPIPRISAELPTLAAMEWEYINRFLVAASGNVSAAARVLGVQRSTLQRKLRKHPPSR